MKFFRAVKVLLICVLLQIFSNPVFAEYYCGSLSEDALSFCQYFNDWDAVHGDNYKSNTENYGWSESRILRAYMEMYHATKELYYLDRFITHTDEVMENRDDITGVVDWKGNSRASWSVIGEHVNNLRYSEVVHSGMIIYPIAKFVQLVYSDPVLKDDLFYKGKADEYLGKIEQVVASHNYRWKEEDYKEVDIGTDEGFYFWAGNDTPINPDLRGWNVPHNMQLAMGSAQLVLYDITGDSDKYKNKAKRTGRIFWRDLDESGGKYLWHYWWGDSLSHSDKYEDMGHAAVDIEYIIEAFHSDFNIGNSSNVFPEDSDLENFAATFSSNLYKSATSYADRVNGESDESDKGTPDRAGQYLDLAEWDPGIYNKIRGTFLNSDNNFTNPNVSGVHKGLIIMGWAKLTHWAKKLGYTEPDEFYYNFNDSSEGWSKPNCSGYTNQWKAGSGALQGNGYLYGKEDSGGGSHQCNPSEAGNVEMSHYRDFANTGASFRVTGWTRTKSSYSGTAAVTNRCVRILDADTLNILHSEDRIWKHTKDTGWSYFDYDFTQHVEGVANVRVVIGAKDSWAHDWDQRIFIDNVEVLGLE